MALTSVGQLAAPLILSAIIFLWTIRPFLGLVAQLGRRLLASRRPLPRPLGQIACGIDDHWSSRARSAGRALLTLALRTPGQFFQPPAPRWAVGVATARRYQQ